MKKTLLFVLFIGTYNFSFGQGKIQGYVLDVNTSEPLSFATIGAVNKNYGCYTDTTGFFTLYFFEHEDSLKISYIGYTDINTTVKDLLNDSQILLIPSPIVLEEVIIRADKIKYKEMDIGYFSKKYHTLNVLKYPVNIKAIHVPSPVEGEDKLLIKSINIAYYNSQFTNDNCPLRVQIITVDKNGKPGDVILSKKVDTENKYSFFRLKKAIVKISDEHIYLPNEGVFVAIEWIVDFQPSGKLYSGKQFGPYIGTTETKQPNIIYIKVYNQPKWNEVQSKNILNIGLTVKKLYNKSPLTGPRLSE